MNITLRKLALLEKSYLEKEENDKMLGYTTSPIDQEFREKITKLLDRVRIN